MRRLYIYLFGLLAGPCFLAGRAEAEPTPTNSAVYAEALSNLKHEHDFARTVQQLQYLVARDSASRDYHLALGCAQADRAVSLGYAALWTKMLADDLAQYPQSVRDWQEPRSATLKATPTATRAPHCRPPAYLSPKTTRSRS